MSGLTNKIPPFLWILIIVGAVALFSGGFGITFFALLGTALARTGNFIHDQPLEWIFVSARISG